MEINHKHIDLFDKYIDGTLGSKWRKAMDEKRATQPEFEAAYQEHLMARKFIVKWSLTLIKITNQRARASLHGN